MLKNPKFKSPQGSGDGGSGGGGDSASGEGGGKGEVGKKWVGFDPTGLERAAKAARELDKSGTVNIVCTCIYNYICIYIMHFIEFFVSPAHAREALELARMQESTHQLKHQEEIAVSTCTCIYIHTLRKTVVRNFLYAYCIYMYV